MPYDNGACTCQGSHAMFCNFKDKVYQALVYLIICFHLFAVEYKDVLPGSKILHLFFVTATSRLLHTPLEISHCFQGSILHYTLPVWPPCKLQVGKGWKGMTTFRFFNQWISLSTVRQKLTNLIGLYYLSSLSIQTSNFKVKANKQTTFRSISITSICATSMSHFNLILKLIFLLHKQQLLGRLGGEGGKQEQKQYITYKTYITLNFAALCFYSYGKLTTKDTLEQCTMLNCKANHTLSHIYIFNALNKCARELIMKDFHSFATKARKFKGTRAAIQLFLRPQFEVHVAHPQAWTTAPVVLQSYCAVRGSKQINFISRIQDNQLLNSGTTWTLHISKKWQLWTYILFYQYL